MDDPYKFLDISLNSDGTITRLTPTTLIPTTEQQEQENSTVFSKDVTLNPTKNTFLRIYAPKSVKSSCKIPLIINFYGGGFMFFSAGSLIPHETCNQNSADIPAVIVSVGYRLAPENRLPAAYDDAIEAIMWVRDQGLRCVDGGECEPWLKEFADFGRCFLMGYSSGGNIVYHAGLRAQDHDLSPLKIQGLIMNQPYFGGVERTNSELNLINDKYDPLHVTDLVWSLTLPIGVDRDHEFSNPMAESIPIEKIQRLPKCLVNGFRGDPLVDRQEMFVKMLESRGVHVVGYFNEGGFHGVEWFEPEMAQKWVDRVKKFIESI